MAQQPGTAFSRRAFIGAAGGIALGSPLAACSRASGDLKFWNMPWGNTAFNTLDRQIALVYKPKNGLPKASYQVIQWANFTQTFSSAIASNTGPAISSGGGTLAFLFESQGKIVYANNLYSKWKKSGLYDDFLPGLIDALRVKKGYAAIPYNLDMRVL